MADDVKLLAVIDANTKAFENALKRIERQTAASFGQADKSVRRIESSLGRAASSASRFGRNFGLAFSGAAVIAIASAAIGKFIRETAESEASVAQLNAALKSTGNAAGLTSKQLQDLASSLANVTVFEDDAITGAESLLLTFTKIGGDTLPQATATVLDMATALKTDLKSASIQVGKALQDPIKGITALRKVGVNFSDSQKTIIASLVKSGQLAKAQAIILKELQTEFGGSAVAARETLGGALQALSVAWGELFEISGPASNRLRLAIEQLITALSDPAFKEAVQTIGVGLVNALKSLVDIAPQVVAEFRAIHQGALDFNAGMEDAVQGAAGVVDALRDMSGLTTLGDALGVTDANLARVDKAHEAVLRSATDLKLLAALQKKLSIAPGEPATPTVVGGGAANNDAALADEEADALNRQADAQKAAAAARKQAAAETARQRKAVTELISDLKFENNLMGLSNEDRAVEITLRRAGAEATAAQRAEIAQLVQVGIGEQKLIDRMDELRDASLGALDAFAQSIQKGEGAAAGLKAALLDVLQTIIRIGEQKAITALFGGQGQTGGGLFGSIIGGLFGAATGGGGPALGSLTAASASVTGGRIGAPVIQLSVVPGQMFEPVVERISGNVSVRHAASAETRAVARTPASARDNQRRFAIP